MNEIEFSTFYWDCECPHNYIKPITTAHCPTCGASKVEQPPARKNEMAALNIQEPQPLRPQDKCLNLRHPLHDAPATADVLKVWKVGRDKVYELLFPDGHHTLLSKAEIAELQTE